MQQHLTLCWAAHGQERPRTSWTTTALLDRADQQMGCIPSLSAASHPTKEPYDLCCTNCT